MRIGRLLIGLITGALVAGLPTVAAAAASGGWNNLGPGFTATYGPLNGKVNVLERVGTKLYVGGDFDNAGGVANADRIAVWNGSSWSAVCPGITGSGNVFSIAVDPVTGYVYAGGSFVNAGGDSLADGLAVCRGGAWHNVGAAGFTSNVNALEVVGRTLFIGGGFLNGGGLTGANFVVAYHLDGGGYFPITDDPDDFSAGPADIEADGAGSVYMCGSFINVNGDTSADFVVHYDGGTSWSHLGTGPGPGFGALNVRCRGIAVSGPNVYAVGDFTNAGGVSAADKIARWNGSTWSALGTASEFGEGAVSLYDVVTDGSRVFTVGNFSNAGGNAKVDGVAAFVNGAWTNVGTDAAGTGGPLTGPSPGLVDVAIVGSRIYIGGLDQDIGGGVLNDSIAFYRLRQPDASIKTTGAFSGNNIYNTTGTNQALSLTKNQGQTGTFTIRVTNDGFSADSFTVEGPGSQGAFTATYERGTTAITAQVVAGSYTISNLAPGASIDLTLSVRVGSSAANGVHKDWLVTVTSSGSGAAKDAVSATVTAG